MKNGAGAGAGGALAGTSAADAEPAHVAAATAIASVVDVHSK
jgi:hypothetical protein